jgi:hypothetical protein
LLLPSLRRVLPLCACLPVILWPPLSLVALGCFWMRWVALACPWQALGQQSATSQLPVSYQSATSQLPVSWFILSFSDLFTSKSFSTKINTGGVFAVAFSSKGACFVRNLCLLCGPLLRVSLVLRSTEVHPVFF